MSVRVLIAEDDADLRQGLVDLLEGEGYVVLSAQDGKEALQFYRQELPDLVLLDVMMPEMSGYDVCREIRQSDPLTPIIMLTAKGEEIDKVVGLELGADDYVTKPFGLYELRARIAAVLRRSQKNRKSESFDAFQIGQAHIDCKSYQATIEGRIQNLTSREMKLLEAFHCRPGEVLSRDELLNAAWGQRYFGTTRTLDQHMAQLRKKLEPNPSSPRYLLTVHGVGYRFVPEGKG